MKKITNYFKKIKKITNYFKKIQKNRKMKIIAIWDRHKVAPRSKSIFCLLDNQRLLFVGPEEEYQGRDKKENRIYKETGGVVYQNAFKENDRFDFNKANYFVTHFGATLLKNFKRGKNK